MVDPVAVTQGPRATEGPRFHGRNGGLRQILLEWRGIRIHSYSVMLYLGLTFGMVARDYAAHLAALPSARVLGAIGRCALQWTREEQNRLGMLNVQQAVCAALVAISLVGLLVLWLGQASPA